MNSLNDQLLELQREWEEKCYNPLKEEYDKDILGRGKLSCAFSFGVSDHYANSNKRIMIVGQEANGHSYDYDQWYLYNWQKWAIAYLNRQVNKERNKDIGYNRSPFWRFFRALEKKGYAPCWNNIDKVRKYCCVDAKDWVECKLPWDEQSKDREILNSKIFNGKSLLQKEIELAAPDAVVFIIGPHNPYYHALSLAFFDGEDVDQRLAEVKPSEKDCCQEISSILGLNIPAYWTYHPNFLSRNKLFNNVIDQIVGAK